MKCNCGKVLQLPAIYLGTNKNGIHLVRFNCSCGHTKEVELQAIKSYRADKSGNANLSHGEYYKYKNGKVKFSCPLCRRLQFIKDPDIVNKEETTLDITCPNGCGFNTTVILEDYK